MPTAHSPQPTAKTTRSLAAVKRREEEAAAKTEKQRAIVEATARCRELAGQIPAGFSDWGVVRTRAWELARARCAEVASFKRPHLGKLRQVIAAVSQTHTAPVESLAKLVYGADAR